MKCICIILILQYLIHRIFIQVHVQQINSHALMVGVYQRSIFVMATMTAEIEATKPLIVDLDAVSISVESYIHIRRF